MASTPLNSSVALSAVDGLENDRSMETVTEGGRAIIASSVEIFDLREQVRMMREQVLEAQDESRRAKLICQQVRSELHALVHTEATKETSETFCSIAALLSNTNSLVEKFALFEQYLRQKVTSEIAEQLSAAQRAADAAADRVSEDVHKVLVSFKNEFGRVDSRVASLEKAKEKTEAALDATAKELKVFTKDTTISDAFTQQSRSLKAACEENAERIASLQQSMQSATDRNAERFAAQLQATVSRVEKRIAALEDSSDATQSMLASSTETISASLSSLKRQVAEVSESVEASAKVGKSYASDVKLWASQEMASIRALVEERVPEAVSECKRALSSEIQATKRLAEAVRSEATEKASAEETNRNALSATVAASLRRMIADETALREESVAEVQRRVTSLKGEIKEKADARALQTLEANLLLRHEESSKAASASLKQALSSAEARNSATMASEVIDAIERRIIDVERSAEEHASQAEQGVESAANRFSSEVKSVSDRLARAEASVGAIRSEVLDAVDSRLKDCARRADLASLVKSFAEGDSVLRSHVNEALRRSEKRVEAALTEASVSNGKVLQRFLAGLFRVFRASSADPTRGAFDAVRKSMSLRSLIKSSSSSLLEGAAIFSTIERSEHNAAVIALARVYYNRLRQFAATKSMRRGAVVAAKAAETASKARSANKRLLSDVEDMARRLKIIFPNEGGDTASSSITEDERLALANDPKLALSRAAQRMLSGEPGGSLSSVLRALIAFVFFIDTDQKRQDSDVDTLSNWVRLIDEEIRKVQKFLRPPFK